MAFDACARDHVVDVALGPAARRRTQDRGRQLAKVNGPYN
jgi:hypothetical protein